MTWATQLFALFIFLTKFGISAFIAYFVIKQAIKDALNESRIENV